jgi:AcrR family transcriptional regulator
MSTDKGVVTRERLIDEAAKLFAEKGYGTATTRELAARLDIQRASLYYHMAGKEELLLEICDSAMTQGLADVRKAISDMPEDDALGRLRQLIFTHLETSLNSHARHLTMLLEMRSVVGEGRLRVLALRAEYNQLIDDLIAQAQRQGTLRADIEASDLRVVLLNMLNWSLTWFSPGGSFTPASLATLYSRVFLEGAETKPSGS